MDVSVIIVNYNTFDLTCNCIRSVLEKTTGCRFEIILVDNASDERDPSEFTRLFPEVELIVNDANLGFARGNNIGIEKASGENILLLNSDAELANNAIVFCLEALRANDRVAAAGCRLTYPDGRLQHSCQRFPAVRYRLFELLRLQKFLPARLGGKVLLGYFFDHASPVFPDWIWGTFFIFKRNLLRSLPGEKLADDFFMYVEDMQWCMEFRKSGYQIAFEPRGHVYHHSGQSGGGKLQMMEVNTNQFMKRYYPAWRRYLIRTLDRWLV